jgi:transcriptional regulator with XRE-family HTH domain
VRAARSCFAVHVPRLHVDHLNTPRFVADAALTTVWQWDQQKAMSSVNERGHAAGAIRRGRERLSLSVEEVARRARVSLSEYHHIENDPRELYMTATLGKVKAICAVLGLEVHEVYGLEKCTKAVGRDVVNARRQDLGLTIPDLARIVGIEERFISDVERDVSALAEWVMDPILDLAKALNVSPACLLACA